MSCIVADEHHQPWQSFIVRHNAETTTYVTEARCAPVLLLVPVFSIWVLIAASCSTGNQLDASKYLDSCRVSDSDPRYNAGWLANFLLLSFLNAFYSFDYKWSLSNKSLEERVYYFEWHWAYFAGQFPLSRQPSPG